MADQLDQLPQFYPAQSAQRGGGALFGSAGVSYLDLRAMGPQRTLMLVDGVRVTPADRNGRVNVDNFPSALLSQVEVVTGGASAAYGADALAGVVNFSFNRDFEGMDLGVVGRTDDGFGDNSRAAWPGGPSSASAGISSGRRRIRTSTRSSPTRPRSAIGSGAGASSQTLSGPRSDPAAAGNGSRCPTSIRRCTRRGAGSAPARTCGQRAALPLRCRRQGRPFAWGTSELAGRARAVPAPARCRCSGRSTQPVDAKPRRQRCLQRGRTRLKCDGALLCGFHFRRQRSTRFFTNLFGGRPESNDYEHRGIRPVPAWQPDFPGQSLSACRRARPR